MFITDEILVNNLKFTEYQENGRIIFIKSGLSSKGRNIPFSMEKCSNGSYTLPTYCDIHEEILEVQHLQTLFKALTGSDLPYCA